MKILILITLSFLHLIRPGLGIGCYICNSRSNPDCSDTVKISKLELTECSPNILAASRNELAHGLGGYSGLNPQQALDLIVGTNLEMDAPMECQKITFNLGDQRVVIRGCHAVGNRWSGAQSEICRVLEEKSRYSTQQSLQETYLYYCGTCDTDGCNSAPHHRTSSAWLTILLTTITVVIASAMVR